MPKARRVRFNKVVDVSKGKSKTLKRVNITKIAHAIINRDHPIDLGFLKHIIKKHKQHGSTRKAIKQTTKSLKDIIKRLHKSNKILIGNKIIYYDDKIIKAKHILENTR